MVDYSIKNILAIGIGIIIIINLVAIIFGSISMNSLSNDVQAKLDNTNDLLTKLNSNIQGLDQLNQQISSIKEDINSIENSVLSLPNNTQSLGQVQNNLVGIKQELNRLSQIYPPNQTIVLNNIEEDNLNTIINNAVDLEFRKIEWKTNWNFGLNIFFGSLLSLGFGFYLYFIFKKKES